MTYNSNLTRNSSMSGYQKRRRTENKGANTVEEEAQRDAARNGRKAEVLLASYIQNHEESTRWIVEEINECPYQFTGAKVRAGIEKPDVVLFDMRSGKDYGLISMKCCVHFHTGFNQIKRSSLKNFSKEFDVPHSIQAILQRYTHGRKKLLLKARNYTQDELDELTAFLNSRLKALLHSAFTGQEKKSKANWLLLHQWTPPNWEKNIAKKTRSELVSMQEILRAFADFTVGYSRYGTITFGAGITLQRKGGDKGKETANDLQFKMRTLPLLKALGRL
jgi:hypothetical protein